MFFTRAKHECLRSEKRSSSHRSKSAEGVILCLYSFHSTWKSIHVYVSTVIFTCSLAQNETTVCFGSRQKQSNNSPLSRPQGPSSPERAERGQRPKASKKQASRLVCLFSSPLLDAAQSAEQTQQCQLWAVSSHPICAPTPTYEAITLGKKQWKCVRHRKQPALARTRRAGAFLPGESQKRRAGWNGLRECLPIDGRGAGSRPRQHT